MASGDLARRPPQGVLGDRRLGAGTVTELGAQIPWRLTGQEHPAQDRAKRTNVDLGARADGDLACDDLAHLGGEPTLLDRHVGRVAGRVDVFEPVHAAVVVDRGMNRCGPWGSPSIPGSSILGRVTTRSTTSRPAGERLSSPSPRYAVGKDPVKVAIPSRASSSPIGSLAWGPNSSSGDASGVTSISSTPSTPSAARRDEVSKASS